VYVGANCPPDCLDREVIIRYKVLPPWKLYHSVHPYKSNFKLMFLLSSACADTMKQGNCIFRTCLVDDVRKAVEVGYDLLDVFEF